MYAGRARGKTMKSQRNLGTMKRDREERRRLKNATGGGNGEIILRILRMRYVDRQAQRQRNTEFCTPISGPEHKDFSPISFE